MEAYEITTKMNLKNTIAETKEFAKAMIEFANALEQIEKKYADDIPQETVTEFADRCRECGKMKRCKDCKSFKYDSAAYGICSKWCAGCTTSEDGYCFLFEEKEGSGE